MRLAHRQRLTGADHMDRQQHIVCRLCDLPSTRRPGMKNLFGTPHASQYDPCSLECGLTAATHKGQRASSGCSHTARNRGIHKVDPKFSGSFADFSRCGGIDRARVQYQRIGWHLRQQTALTQKRTRDMLTCGQHTDDHVGLRHGIQR